MTTSVLLTHCPGELNGYDMQVLRDYAIEAPREWRLALEQLIEKAERTDKLEEELYDARTNEMENEHAVKELRGSVNTATKKLLPFIEQLELGERNGFAAKANFTEICEGLRSSFESLVDAAK